MAYDIVFLVVGAPGSGKSYQRAARFVADEFLPNRTGVHYSNLPINVDAMAEYVAEKHGIAPEETRRRIQRIPGEVLRGWLEEKHGPWEYFADREDGTNPCDKAHIAFDECHVYLPRGRKSTMAWRKSWEGWLGTIRKRGCTLEFITQAENKVAVEIVDHCESMIYLSSGLNERIPYVGTRLDDIYQVVAKLRGKYLRFSLIFEYAKDGKRWKCVSRRVNVLLDKYFELYQTNNDTEHGDSGGEGEKPEWERFGWLRFIRWFWSRNWFGVSIVTLALVSLLGFILALRSGILFRWIGSISQSVASVDASEVHANQVVVGGEKVVESAEGSGLEKSPDVGKATRKRRVQIMTIGTQIITTNEGGIYGIGEVVGDWTIRTLDAYLGVVGLARDGTERRVRLGTYIEVDEDSSGISFGNFDDSQDGGRRWNRGQRQRDENPRNNTR